MKSKALGCDAALWRVEEKEGGREGGGDREEEAASFFPIRCTSSSTNDAPLLLRFASLFHSFLPFPTAAVIDRTTPSPYLRGSRRS